MSEGEHQGGQLSGFSDLHKIKFLRLPLRSSFLQMNSGVLAYLGLMLSSPSANVCVKSKGTGKGSFNG